MSLDSLREALVDLHSRWHHDCDLARSRAETILEVVKAHLDPTAFTLDCTPITIVEPIPEVEP